MPLGPGKYDKECTAAREVTEADACLLIIVKGKKGSGFSCQTRSPISLISLPGLLRSVADEMDKSMEEMMKNQPSETGN
jgi:hypothetical protein